MADAPLPVGRARLETALAFAAAAALYVGAWAEFFFGFEWTMPLVPVPGALLAGALFGPTLARQAREGSSNLAAAGLGLVMTVLIYVLGLAAVVVLQGVDEGLHTVTDDPLELAGVLLLPALPVGAGTGVLMRVLLARL